MFTYYVFFFFVKTLDFCMMVPCKWSSCFDWICLSILGLPVHKGMYCLRHMERNIQGVRVWYKLSGFHPMCCSFDGLLGFYTVYCDISEEHSATFRVIELDSGGCIHLIQILSNSSFHTVSKPSRLSFKWRLYYNAQLTKVIAKYWP